jgi:hypothetical protein
VPELLVVADAYGEMLLAQNQIVEAFLAIEKSISYQSEISSYEWEIFWDIGKGFSAAHRKMLLPTINKTGAFQLSFTLPDSVKKIRFDPPPFLNLVISNPVLSVNDKKFNLWELPLTFHQVTQNQNQLITTGGGDPIIRLTLPKSGATAMNTIKFFANVEKQYTELKTITKIVESPQYDDLKKQLVLIGKVDSFERLTNNKIVLDNYIDNKKLFPQKSGKHPFDLFWLIDRQRFTKERMKRVFAKTDLDTANTSFNLKFLVDEMATTLRFDFPQKQKSIYTINKFIVQGNKGSISIDLNNISILNSHSLEKKNNVFRVIGDDPYFTFALPNKPIFINQVQVEGLVQ